MPFGYKHTPAFFQAMMNQILKNLLERGAVRKIDDILIYSEYEEIITELLKKVLDRLGKYDLGRLPEKCVWRENNVKFLGYILSTQEMRMAEDTRQAT
jgi:hypothetical protein